MVTCVFIVLAAYKSPSVNMMMMMSITSISSVCYAMYVWAFDHLTSIVQMA